MAVEDTHPKACARQIELMRAATPQRRFALAASLTRSVVFLSRRALRRSRPHATQEEIDRLWVLLHYGALAARLMDNGSERTSVSERPSANLP